MTCPLAIYVQYYACECIRIMQAATYILYLNEWNAAKKKNVEMWS